TDSAGMSSAGMSERPGDQSGAAALRSGGRLRRCAGSEPAAGSLRDAADADVLVSGRGLALFVPGEAGGVHAVALGGLDVAEREAAACGVRVALGGVLRVHADEARVARVGVLAGAELLALLTGGVEDADEVALVRDAQVAGGAVLQQRVAARQAEDEHAVVGDRAGGVRHGAGRGVRRAAAELDAGALAGVLVGVPAHVAD